MSSLYTQEDKPLTERDMPKADNQSRYTLKE